MNVKDLNTNEQQLINSIRNSKDVGKALVLATSIICAFLTNQENKKANKMFDEYNKSNV